MNDSDRAFMMNSDTSATARDETQIDAGYRVRVTAQAGCGELGEWDRSVDGVALSDVAQLSRWSEVRADAGFVPLHFLVRRTEQLVGGVPLCQRGGDVFPASATDRLTKERSR